MGFRFANLHPDGKPASIKFATMLFDEYLTGKKIDPAKFKHADPAQYAEFQKIFDQVHPESFTQQKLFLINQIRRAYKPEEQAAVKKAANPSKAMRPRIKPLKPKTS